MSVGHVKKLLVKFSNSLPNKANYQPLPMKFLDIVDDSFFKIDHNDIKKSYLFLNFTFNHNYLERDFKTKLDVVMSMVNNYTDGLQKQMRLEKSLVYGCYFSQNYYLTNATATLYTECEKGNINEILKTTADYIKSKLQNGFTQAELDKYKREWKYDEEVKEPRTNKYMTNLNHLALYGDVRKKKYIDKLIKNITLEECNALFREVFAVPRVSSTIYGDATKDDIMGKTEFKNLFKF